MDQPIGCAKAVWLWNQATAWAKSLWYALPKQVQTVIIFAAPSAGATLYKLLFDTDHPCWAWHCIWRDLGASLSAGAYAAKSFHWRPGSGPHAAETPYEGS